MKQVVWIENNIWLVTRKRTTISNTNSDFSFTGELLFIQRPNIDMLYFKMGWRYWCTMDVNIRRRWFHGGDYKYLRQSKHARRQNLASITAKYHRAMRSIRYPSIRSQLRAAVLTQCLTIPTLSLLFTLRIHWRRLSTISKEDKCILYRWVYSTMYFNTFKLKQYSAKPSAHWAISYLSLQAKAAEYHKINMELFVVKIFS